MLIKSVNIRIIKGGGTFYDEGKFKKESTKGIESLPQTLIL